MVTEEAEWQLPQSRPITRETLAQAIATDEAASSIEHYARAVWFDKSHDAVAVVLRDGRIFGAERKLIPALAQASPRHLRTLRTTEDGAFLVIDALDLHINVDGLVRRLLEGSAAAVRQAAARMAGRTISAAKSATSAQNGRLGGRPRKTAKPARDIA